MLVAIILCMQCEHDNGASLEVPFKLIDPDDVTLEHYCYNRHGFMCIQVTDKLIIGECYATNLPHEP